jgi:hypothetical protein
LSRRFSPPRQFVLPHHIHHVNTDHHAILTTTSFLPSRHFYRHVICHHRVTFSTAYFGF